MSNGDSVVLVVYFFLSIYPKPIQSLYLFYDGATKTPIHFWTSFGRFVSFLRMHKRRKKSQAHFWMSTQQAPSPRKADTMDTTATSVVVPGWRFVPCPSLPPPVPSDVELVSEQRLTVPPLLHHKRYTSAWPIPQKTTPRAPSVTPCNSPS